MFGDILGCHTVGMLEASGGKRLGRLLETPSHTQASPPPQRLSTQAKMSVPPRLMNTVLGYKLIKAETILPILFILHGTQL